MVGQGGMFGVVGGRRSTLAAGVTVMGTTGGEWTFSAHRMNDRDAQEPERNVSKPRRFGLGVMSMLTFSRFVDMLAGTETTVFGISNPCAAGRKQWNNAGLQKAKCEIE